MLPLAPPFAIRVPLWDEKSKSLYGLIEQSLRKDVPKSSRQRQQRTLAGINLPLFQGAFLAREDRNMVIESDGAQVQIQPQMVREVVCPDDA